VRALRRRAVRHENFIESKGENMSIARFTTAFALGLLAVQLASGAAVACDNPGKTHKLSFKVTDDGCVAKVKKDADDADAETINVCEKDVVEWKVTGKAKSIVFDGNSPFDWADSRFKDRKIEGTVKSGTAGEEFKYSVKVDGLACVHDPKIIVDH
jgi:hypothetical protein